jgi:hypothetical protein
VTTDHVVLHPVLAGLVAGIEHGAGELSHLGDALGVDVFVVRHDGRFIGLRDGDGARNEDWYSWRAPVLAPCDGVVEGVRVNAVTNAPGTFGPPPASAVTVRRDDGVHVVVAHVQAIEVAEGEAVTAGQRIAEVGNNGVSNMPHIHVGAWRGDTPLQIRWDLDAVARLRRPT